MHSMSDARDHRPVVTDPDAGEPVEQPVQHEDDDLDTHTAALQGAAAGGAMGGRAGYAGGLMTGSEDGIGIREIPDDETEGDPATR